MQQSSGILANFGGPIFLRACVMGGAFAAPLVEAPGNGVQSAVAVGKRNLARRTEVGTRPARKLSLWQLAVIFGVDRAPDEFDADFTDAVVLRDARRPDETLQPRGKQLDRSMIVCGSSGT